MDKNLLTALKAPLITQISGREVFTEVQEAVKNAYIDSGSKCPEENETQYFERLVNDLTGIIQSRFCGLHKGEIKIAFERGAIGDFGEVYGLNKKNFVMFLSAHLKSDERKRAESVVFSKARQEVNPVNGPSKEELFKISTGIALRAFELFKFGNSTITCAPFVYDFFKKIKLIELSKSETETLLTQAKPIVLAEKMRKKTSGESWLKSIIPSVIEATDQELINKAKELAMFKYFGALEGGPAELEHLIKSRAIYFK